MALVTAQLSKALERPLANWGKRWTKLRAWRLR